MIIFLTKMDTATPLIELKQDKRRLSSPENARKARETNLEKMKKRKDIREATSIAQLESTEDKIMNLQSRIEEIQQTFDYLKEKQEFKGELIVELRKIFLERIDDVTWLKREASDPKFKPKLIDLVRSLLTEPDRVTGAEGTAKVEFNIIGSDVPVRISGNPKGEMVVDIGKKDE